MQKLPISVFIITKNEEDRVPVAINSVKDWVDEVIVVDSGSTDKTLQIAEKMGAKVLFNEWKGYGPQKVFSEKLCRNNWLLNIDADEEVSTSLRDEIITEFQNNKPRFKGYKVVIKVVNRFNNKVGVFAPSHTQLRLYHKDYAGFKDSIVHDSVVFKENIYERVYKFKNPVLHRSFRSYAHAIEKINNYSSMQAEDMVKRGRYPSTIRIITEPFISFFKGYFIKRHCFLGAEGFIEGIIYSFARTLRLIKARELWEMKKLKQGDGV